MKGFIEVTEVDSCDSPDYNTLINIRNIVSVFPNNEETAIRIFEEDFIFVKESYEEVKEKIRLAIE